ncbi:MAG TPA: signal peptidase I, partial [Vulgatibacter sp.]
MARSDEERLLALLAESRRVARFQRRRLGPNALAELAALQSAAKQALASGDAARIENARAALDAAARTHKLATLRKSLLREYVEVVVVAALVALAFRHSVAETFRVPSGSMLPTLRPGDVVLVNKLAYGARLPIVGWLSEPSSPAVGEIVVFEDPRTPGEVLVKRVAGVAGDTVALHDEIVSIDGEAQPRVLAEERYEFWNFRDDLRYWHPQSGALYLETLGGRRHATVHSRMLPGPRPDLGPFRVPAGSIFVLGDNRDDSDDGRSGGGWYVPVSNVLGRVSVVLFSWGKGGAWP